MGNRTIFCQINFNMENVKNILVFLFLARNAGVDSGTNIGPIQDVVFSSEGQPN